MGTTVVYATWGAMPLVACLPARLPLVRKSCARQLAKERGFRSLAYGTELSECMASCALEDRIGEPRQVFVPKVLTGWRPSAGNKRTKWLLQAGIWGSCTGRKSGEKYILGFS